VLQQLPALGGAAVPADERDRRRDGEVGGRVACALPVVGEGEPGVP
jgi:hypothetical protein